MEPGPPSGYRQLLIAREGTSALRNLTDPDGNLVTLAPPGHRGVDGVAIRLGVRDLEAHRRFYSQALELEEVVENAFRCGDSLFIVEHDPTAVEVGPLQSPNGYRYVTIQVWNADEDYARITANGGAGARAPFNLGTTARICWVRDPDGNWIEVSQRASLTGPLPDK